MTLEPDGRAAACLDESYLYHVDLLQDIDDNGHDGDDVVPARRDGKIDDAASLPPNATSSEEPFLPGPDGEARETKSVSPLSNGDAQTLPGAETDMAHNNKSTPVARQQQHPTEVVQSLARELLRVLEDDVRPDKNISFTKADLRQLLTMQDEAVPALIPASPASSTSRDDSDHHDNNSSTGERIIDDDDAGCGELLGVDTSKQGNNGDEEALISQLQERHNKYCSIKGVFEAKLFRLMVQQREKEEKGRALLVAQIQQAKDSNSSTTLRILQERLQEQEQHIADIQSEQQQLMELTIASAETASEIIRIQQTVLWSTRDAPLAGKAPTDIKAVVVLGGNDNDCVQEGPRPNTSRDTAQHDPTVGVQRQQQQQQQQPRRDRNGNILHKVALKPATEVLLPIVDCPSIDGGSITGRGGFSLIADSFWDVCDLCGMMAEPELASAARARRRS